jgi:MFS family permease
MDLNLEDYYVLLHPAIAIVVVFPILGLIVRLAWQTRQRRLQFADGQRNSKIRASVGSEHLQLGRWFSGAVVALALLGLSNSILSAMVLQQGFNKEPLRYSFILLMFAATIASLVLLYKAQSKLWRGVFATLTGMGVILLGCQPEVFRRTDEWYISHYYYGIAVTMLMIFSLAIVPDIYRDRKNRWRRVHIILNSIALIFFIAQAFLGVRDLLEIPLSWQEAYIGKCDFVHKICP